MRTDLYFKIHKSFELKDPHQPEVGQSIPAYSQERVNQCYDDVHARHINRFDLNKPT